MVKIAKKAAQHHQDPSFQMKVNKKISTDCTVFSDG
jgi:hypothetical protein